MARRASAPTLRHERELWDAGHDVVVGLDEVGRGAWAGPLSVGAAILPRDRRVYGVRDSKALTERRREELFDRVSSWCVGWSVGHASPDECDRLGMSAAQRLAAGRALHALGLAGADDVGGAPPSVQPRFPPVLVDGSWDFVGHGTTRTIVRGDASCLSIAAASILAKVTRDRIMRDAGEHHPGYDFERNKGYPCPRHQLAIAGYGPTAIHRRSWAFMDSVPWQGRRRGVASPARQLTAL